LNSGKRIKHSSPEQFDKQLFPPPNTMTEKNTRRRNVLTTTGTLALTTLAGCSSLLESDDEPDLKAVNTSDNQDQQKSDNPPNESKDENNNQSEPEEKDEKEPSQQEYTWQDILEAEQQFYERNVDPIYRNTARSLSNGRVPDTKYSPSDFDFSSIIGYTDNSGEFSIERFKEESYENALQDLSTLMFLKAVERNNGNPGVSGMTRQMGLASERVFENLRNQKIRYSKVNNDSHGFWALVLSPREDPYTVDVNTNYQDETWEDPMRKRSGISPIPNFDEDMIPEETLISRELVAEYQTMLRRISDQPGNDSIGTGVNPELMPEINEELSSPGSMYHRLVPAMAVLNHQAHVDPGKGYILNPDSFMDLPEFRPEKDDFQEYRKQVEKDIVTYSDEDRFDEVLQGLEPV
jgi:hypothetical protein